MMSGVSPDSILELFCGFTERYLVLSDEFTSIASFAGLELGDWVFGV